MNIFSSLFVVLVVALVFSAGIASAGDCSKGTKPQDPEFIALHEKAAKESAHFRSRLYGKNLTLCQSNKEVSQWNGATLPAERAFLERSKKSFVYAVSSGDHKCGKHSPFERTEFISTVRLRKEYEEFGRRDIRIWVAGPGGKSRILADPRSVSVHVPQSIRDCIRLGPDGFSCRAGMKRRQCCRDHLAPIQGLEVVYDHPYDETLEIVFSSISRDIWERLSLRSKGETQVQEEVQCAGPEFMF